MGRTRICIYGSVYMCVHVISYTYECAIAPVVEKPDVQICQSH